jgi:hypothetical protein
MLRGPVSEGPSKMSMRLQRIIGPMVIRYARTGKRIAQLLRQSEPARAARLLALCGTLSIAAFPGFLNLGRAITVISAPTIATVQAAAVSRNGHIVALDRERNRIYGFDSLGRLRDSAGGFGRRPENLVGPTAVATDAAHDLFVIDPPARRVVRYRESATSIAYVSAFSIAGIAGSGICAMRNRVYVLGSRMGSSGPTAIHAFTPRGAPVSDFGSLFGPPEDKKQDPRAVPVGRILTQGRLACVPDASLVIALPRLVPEVRAYSVDGALVWSHSLTHYLATVVRREENGGLTLAMGPNGDDEGVSVFPVSAGVIAVQIARMVAGKNASGGPSRARLETRFLSTQDGHELGVQDGLSEILDASGDYALTSDRSTSAHLELHHLRRTTGE